MATKFEFWLSEENTERLFAAKEDNGFDNLTGNDYAKMLVEEELYRLHPSLVRYDENGRIE